MKHFLKLPKKRPENRPFRNLLSDEGSTLITVMVAAGLSVIVALGIATMIRNMSDGVNSVKFRSDADIINEEIRALLSSEAACRNTFGTFVIAPPAAPALLNMPVTDLKDATTPTPLTKYSQGQTYGDRSLAITAMALKEYAAGGAVNVAQVSLETSMGTSKTASGPQTISRKVHVSITTNATGLITNCVALSKMSDGIWQKSSTTPENIFYMPPPSAGVGNGWVGVGTATPNSFVQFVKNIDDGIEVRVDNELDGPQSHSQFTAGNGYKTGGNGVSVTMGVRPPGFAGWGVIRSKASYLIGSDDLIVATASNLNPIIFALGTTGLPGGGPEEAMRINPLGKVGIGNSNPATFLHVGSAAVGSGTSVARFENQDGVCVMTPAAGGSGIACSSDERLKENIEDISGSFALDRILKMQAVIYNFKTDASAKPHTGYLAQELQKVAPEFVRQDESGFFQVYYDGLIPWITEAIKALDHRLTQVLQNLNASKREIAQLRANDAAKEQKIQELEKRLQLIEQSMKKAK